MKDCQGDCVGHSTRHRRTSESMLGIRGDVGGISTASQHSLSLSCRSFVKYSRHPSASMFQIFLSCHLHGFQCCMISCQSGSTQPGGLDRTKQTSQLMPQNKSKASCSGALAILTVHSAGASWRISVSLQEFVSCSFCPRGRRWRTIFP